jgi:hypothetical protein
MLRAAYGNRIGLAIAGILAGAFMGLAFSDVAEAGRGGGGGFHGGGGGFHGGGGSMLAGAAVSMGAVALQVVFVAEAFTPSTPRRTWDAVTAHGASNPAPPTPTPVATRDTAIMVERAFRKAPSQAAAPSRTA